MASMADDFEENAEGAMSQQLQQLDDERQREVEDQYVIPNPSAMPLPTHLYNGRNGFCSPDTSFYGASYQLLGGGPASTGSTTDYAPGTASMIAPSSSTTSANYNITANNGNFHFHTPAESQAAAQLAQGFLPHNAATANSDNATSSYYGSSSSAVPSPAHIHHHALQTSPWTANPAAYFMLPKTSFEPYGLSHPASYSTYGSSNYYQHQAAQNYGGAYGCPAAAAAAAAHHHHQYGLSYYPSPSASQISPEEGTTSLAISQRPLNLSDSRLMPHHHQQPIRHPFVNSYGGEPIYPSGPSFVNGNNQYHSHYSSNQGLYYQSTDQQSTESPSPPAPVLQREEEEKAKDDGGNTEDKNVVQFCDKSAIVQAAEALDADPDVAENEIDVADYKSDLVIVEEEHSLQAAQLLNDSNLNPIDNSDVKDFVQLKPKSRKRIRGRPKKDHALELLSFKQPSAFVMPDIDAPAVPAADDEDDGAAPIKIPKSRADLRTGFSTFDVQEPIVRTPDSSGTLNTAQKPAKKRIRKRSRQPASSHSADKVLPITNYQIQALEAKFQENPFLSDVEDRRTFGSKIDLAEHRIAVWFQNRRTKERKVGRMPAGVLPTGYNHPENQI